MCIDHIRAIAALPVPVSRMSAAAIEEMALATALELLV